MTIDRLLITGGGGYVARRVARRFLETREGSVLLWLHAADAQEFATKRAAMMADFSSFGLRVAFAWGELAWEEPFAGIDPAGVSHILHGAAITRFNVESGPARRVNVDGTAKLLAFAERCPALEVVGLLSTVYASGLTPGLILEQPLHAGYGFANFYERSKWEAEARLLDGFSHLPWRIFRIATAIADDRSGTVSHENALHKTLKLLYSGLLPVIPGRPETPVYLVSGDFVADALVRLTDQRVDDRIFHVCPTVGGAPRLEEILRIAFEAFASNEGFRRRRVRPPVFADVETFRIVVEGVARFSSAILRQAMEAVAPFARQLYVNKRVSNERLTAALDDYKEPDGRALVRATCAELAGTRWGKEARDAV